MLFALDVLYLITHEEPELEHFKACYFNRIVRDWNKKCGLYVNDPLILLHVSSIVFDARDDFSASRCRQCVFKALEDIYSISLSGLLISKINASA